MLRRATNAPLERRLGLLGLLGGLALAAGGCGKVEARALAKQGNAAYREGKLSEALAKYEQAVAVDPELALAHLHRGYACLGLLAEAPEKDASGKQAADYARRARDAFGRFIELAPGDERGPRFYLQVLVDGGRYDEALRFLEKQHAKNPRDVQVVGSLGLVSSKAGRFDAALKWYEKRAALLPREAQARYLVGTACWEHLHNNAGVAAAERKRVADRGIAALEQAVRLRPGYIEAITYINLLYRERALAHGDDAAAKARDMQRAEEHHKRALTLLSAQQQQPSQKQSQR